MGNIGGELDSWALFELQRFGEFLWARTPQGWGEPPSHALNVFGPFWPRKIRTYCYCLPTWRLLGMADLSERDFHQQLERRHSQASGERGATLKRERRTPKNPQCVGEGQANTTCMSSLPSLEHQSEILHFVTSFSSPPQPTIVTLGSSLCWGIDCKRPSAI